MSFTLLPQKKKDVPADDLRKEFEPYYKGGNRIAAFIINNMLYIVSFLIPFMLLLFLMRHFSFAPFGNHSLFVMDGAYYNTAILNDLIYSIQNGSFHFFTTNGSVGSEYYSTIAFYLSSPFTLFCLLFDQQTAIGLLSLFTVLRISLSAPVFIYYLTHRENGRKYSKFDIALLVFALGYALSSYALVQYNDFMYLDIFMLFPLLILGLERFMQRKNSKMLYIVLSVCLFSNFYLGLIMLLFLSLYYFFQSRRSAAETCAGYIRLLGVFLLSVCTSAVTVIPGFAGVYRSLITTAWFPSPGNYADYFTLFLQQFFYGRPSYNSVYLSGSNLYFGTFALLLLFAHFFNRKLSVKRRCADFVFLAIVVLALNNAGMHYLFHLCTVNDTSFTSYAFVYLFLALIWGIDSFYSIHDIPFFRLILSGVLPIALGLVCINFTELTPHFDSVSYTVNLLVIYTIALVLYRIRSIRRKSFYYIVVTLSVLELLANAFQLNFMISQEEVSIEELTTTTNPLTETLLPLQHSEFPGSIYSADSFLYQLSSRYSINTLISKADSAPVTPLTDSMAGVRYWYTTKNTAKYFPHDSQYSAVSTMKGYDVYENKYCFPSAYLVNRKLDGSLVTTDYFSEQNSLARSLGAGSDMFTTEDFEMTVSATTEDVTTQDLGNHVYSFLPEPGSQATETGNIRVNVKFTAPKDGELYFMYGLTPYYFGSVDAGEDYNFSYSEPSMPDFASVTWIQAAYYHADVMEEVYDAILQNPVALQSADSSAVLAMQLSCPDESTLLTLLPYSDAFRVYVDGNRADTFSHAGYLAAILDGGEHTVEVRYTFVPFTIGLYLTILTLVLLACVSFVFAAKKIPQIKVSFRLTEKMQTVFDFILENRIYVLSFALPLGILLIIMFVTGCEPFGIKSIFSGDGCDMTLPNAFLSYRLLQEGLPSFMWTGGSGVGVARDHIQYIGYLLFPLSCLPVVYALMTVCKIALCGPTLIFYLTHRLTGPKAFKKDYRLLISSTAYCLCNYMVIMLNNTSWYHVLILFPLILLGMDYLMERGKKRYYIFVLSLSFLLQYYITMFVCFYLVIRFFTYHFADIKDFFKKGVRFALCSLSVAGLGFYKLYMGLSSVGGSNYSSTDAVLPASEFFNSFTYIFNRQGIFAPAPPVTWNEGGVCLYFGILPLLLLMIYIFVKGISIKEKLRNLIPYAILFFSLNHSVLNYFLNGMHYQHGVPNRYAFLLSFIAASISYDCLRVLKKNTLLPIGVGAALIAAVLAGSYYLPAEVEQSHISILLSLGLVLFYALLLSALRLMKGRRRRHTVSFILTIVCVVELGVNAGYQIAGNTSSTYNVIYQQSIVGMLNDNTDFADTLERIGAVSSLNVNYPYVTGAKSAQIFSTSISPYRNKLGEYTGMNAAPNASVCTSSQSLMGNALSYNHYLMVCRSVSTVYAGDLKYYRPFAQNGQGILFENKTFLPFGYYLPATLENALPEGGETEELWASLGAAVLGDANAIVDKTKLVNKAAGTKGELTTDYYYVTQQGDKSFYHIVVNMPIDGDLYLHLSDLKYVGYFQKGETAEIEVDITDYTNTSDTAMLDATILHNDAIESFCDIINEHPLNVTGFTNETVDGTITMPQDGIINLSTGYDPHWHVYLDGEEVETMAFAQAFLAVSAAEGEHALHMEYVNTDWVFPSIVTLVSWVIFALGCVCFDRRRKLMGEMEDADDVKEMGDVEDIDDMEDAEDMEEM